MATAMCSGSPAAAPVVEDVTDLEQAHVGAAVTGVGGDGSEQPGQQRRPQHRSFGGERVFDLEFQAITAEM